MRVVIDQVTKGADGVWSANIDPQRLIRLAPPLRQGGGLSVVLISHPDHDLNSNSLQFDLDSAVLLNLGNSHESVLLASRETAPGQQKADANKSVRLAAQGDRGYLRDLARLPDGVRELGEKLLNEVRNEYPGELVYAEASGKYVETPDNFWVVRIQPRAKNLRIVVFGEPDRHAAVAAIKLKKDRNGYSSFLIDSPSQLPEAVKIIFRAKQLKRGR